MYSSTLPSTSALDGVSGQRHAPAALPPGNTRCVGPRVGVDRCGKSRPPPPGFDPRTIQSVASRYTDCAIPGPECSITSLLLSVSVQRSVGTLVLHLCTRWVSFTHRESAHNSHTIQRRVGPTAGLTTLDSMSSTQPGIELFLSGLARKPVTIRLPYPGSQCNETCIFLK